MENNKSIFATGCDSKVICLKEINGKFVVSSEVRGQSHDILGMCFIDGNILVSGGLSTDLCYYPLENGDFVNKYTNRPSLTNKRLISYNNNKHYILVNQMRHFEIWKYNLSLYETEFLLRFESKSII